MNRCGELLLALLTRIVGGAWAALFLAQAAAAQTVPGTPAAEEKPLFEIGVLGAGGTLPDYPASAQNHWHALALPYLIYRGEYLQLAANSIRGIILKTDRVNLDVSASGAVSNHDDAARVGMPGLDYMGQIGPRLNVLLAQDATYGKIDFELPLRAVFSTDFKSVDYRGLVLTPEIGDTQEDFLDTGGTLKVWIGPEFATARLMDYFYTVAPRFVIPGRPQFTAHGGYLGSHLDVTYRHPIGRRASVFGYVGPELNAGATNEASPLFKKKYGISAGLAFSYSFYQSDAKAQVESDEECCAR
jgi:outer membrane protein